MSVTLHSAAIENLKSNVIAFLRAYLESEKPDQHVVVKLEGIVSDLNKIQTYLEDACQPGNGASKMKSGS